MVTVLHIITGLDRGGAETVLYRLLSNMADRISQQHVVISLQGNGHFGQKLIDLGVPVHALEMNGVLDFPRAFLKLVVLMRGLRPAIVQTWLYHADLLGGLAALFSGRPAVIWGVHTVHLDKSASIVTAFIRRVCAWTSSWLPTTILCVAQAALDNHAKLGYDRKRMKVVPNGFDIPDTGAHEVEALALRRSCGFQESHIVVGCIGRFHPDKDYYTFLRGASLLKALQPNARFLLVGKELLTSNKQLMRWIVEQDLESHVVALGERSDVLTCLMAMDVFCLPSQTEAFPLALGEAMAAGRPVVATDVGDVALLVGGTGIIVAARDAEALCGALHEMLTLSENQRQQLGIQARNRIKNEFSIKAMASRIQKVYSFALSQN